MKEGALTYGGTLSLLLLVALVACTDRADSLSVSSQSSSSVAVSGDALRWTAANARHAIEAALPGDEVSTLPAPADLQTGQVLDFYQRGNFALAWVDGNGHPSRDARDAASLLRQAADEGLDPADYQTSLLDSLAAGLDATATPSLSDVAAFDTSMSAGMLSYFRQLHTGRIDPQSVGFKVDRRADHHDFVALLRSAVAGHRLAAAARELEPPLALYRGLRGMLARYRALAADPALEPPPALTSTVKPGDAYDGLTLRRWLIAIGDLPANAAAPAEARFEGALVDGVKHFQVRHGLEADGSLGKATQAALRVSLQSRVRQIELALERLRWLPDLSPDRFLAVNIPMFRLWVWNAMPPDGAPTFGMGVIVGRALNTRTPVFIEEMRSIVFRPYWNVPPSILRGEILPRLRRDPDYLRREDMEIVQGDGDDARTIALTAQSLDQLQQGRLRVRQRPGPKNALGLVKFIFPNDANVYMHGTPAPQLFGRPRRDFSHGCVRLEDPVGLAEWALDGQGGWTRDRILAAMNGAKPESIKLARPIQVILFYITAVVMPDDGTIRFSEDIYGHDGRLDKALVQRANARRSSTAG